MKRSDMLKLLIELGRKNMVAYTEDTLVKFAADVLNCLEGAEMKRSEILDIIDDFFIDNFNQDVFVYANGMEKASQLLDKLEKAGMKPPQNYHWEPEDDE
jgi:hypothetical protein